ncbi:unnamed protein product [Symbiodinium sp. CCMP2592]|nr:unnamed protein product [Symbiodinium sp. CCMP2592]
MARSSSFIHFKIQAALAEVYFDLDRKALKAGVRCMGLAEDGRGPFQFIRCRAVLHDYSVRQFVLDLIPNEGQKAAPLTSVRDSRLTGPVQASIDKARQIQEAIGRFSKHDVELQEIFRKHVQEQDTLAGLRAVIRCNVHASTKALEKALQADDAASELINEWALRFSTQEETGSFARGINNSHKMKETFQKLEGVVANFHFAPQRFGSIASVCELVVLNITPIFRFLCGEAESTDRRNAKWACRLLKSVFKPERLLLLALLGELSSAAIEFSHRFDNLKDKQGSSLSHSARTAYFINQLEQKIERLFGFRSADNELRRPLVLHESYTSGYVQTLRTSWNFLSGQVKAVSGEMVFYAAGAGGEEQITRWVSTQLGVVRNIARNFLQGIRAEFDNLIAMSLQPFDLEWWQTRSDDSLSGT